MVFIQMNNYPTDGEKSKSKKSTIINVMIYTNGSYQKKEKWLGKSLFDLGRLLRTRQQDKLCGQRICFHGLVMRQRYGISVLQTHKV